MLAMAYEGQNINGWLMSEKLDGVRAIWTGQELMSRNGNPFYAPDWFTRQLPAGVMLDGELFVGRGKFQATASVVKKKVPVDSEWQSIRYCVFDAPEVEGGFEVRLAFCASALTGCEIAEVVAHRVCVNHSDLESFFSELHAQGAEGVMLREPNSSYDKRRSASLLKFKKYESSEAVMIGQEACALVLKWNDVVFKVANGLNEQECICFPRIGSIISFGFCGLTDGGVPRFPTFLSERDYE